MSKKIQIEGGERYMLIEGSDRCLRLPPEIGAHSHVLTIGVGVPFRSGDKEDSPSHTTYRPTEFGEWYVTNLAPLLDGQGCTKFDQQAWVPFLAPEQDDEAVALLASAAGKNVGFTRQFWMPACTYGWTRCASLGAPWQSK